MGLFIAFIVIFIITFVVICVLKYLNFCKLDIEAAFLEGTSDETVFVSVPYGIEYVDSKLKKQSWKIE